MSEENKKVEAVASEKVEETTVVGDASTEEVVNEKPKSKPKKYTKKTTEVTVEKEEDEKVVVCQELIEDKPKIKKLKKAQKSSQNQ